MLTIPQFCGGMIVGEGYVMIRAIVIVIILIAIVGTAQSADLAFTPPKRVLPVDSKQQATFRKQLPEFEKQQAIKKRQAIFERRAAQKQQAELEKRQAIKRQQAIKKQQATLEKRAAIPKTGTVAASGVEANTGTQAQLPETAMTLPRREATSPAQAPTRSVSSALDTRKVDRCTDQWGDWAQLTSADQKSWSALGWTPARWASGKSPTSESKRWEELSRMEKSAASRLGFNAKNWDVDCR
jgi:hypothetical protein